MKKGALISFVLLGMMFTIQSVFAKGVLDDSIPADCPACGEGQRSSAPVGYCPYIQPGCPEVPPIGVKGLELCWTLYDNPARQCDYGYLDLTIAWDSDVDDDIDGDDCHNTYPGWCADMMLDIIRGPCFPVILWSSINTINPHYYTHDDENWNEINYIFTQWLAENPTPPYDDANWKDIQQVVWIFADGKQDEEWDWLENNWVNKHEPYGNLNTIISIWEDARNHDDFVPAIGEKMAIICDSGKPRRQLLFFVATRIPDIPVPEVPIGTLAIIAASFVALIVVQYRERIANSL